MVKPVTVCLCLWSSSCSSFCISVDKRILAEFLLAFSSLNSLHPSTSQTQLVQTQLCHLHSDTDRGLWSAMWNVGSLSSMALLFYTLTVVVPSGVSLVWFVYVSLMSKSQSLLKGRTASIRSFKGKLEFKFPSNIHIYYMVQKVPPQLVPLYITRTGQRAGKDVLTSIIHIQLIITGAWRC